MPQVDLESLLCGGDGKVACETVISGEDARTPAENDRDFPAESFIMRIGDEIEWTDINAAYERDDSTKGNTNPKSQHANPKPPRSNSQRYSGNLKPKAPIIALPNKLQHSGYLGSSVRRPTNSRIFPKKMPGGRKSTAPALEPGSPKVSCFGKVRSEREREKSRRENWKAASAAASAADEEDGNRTQYGGCWAFFRCGRSEAREFIDREEGTVSVKTVPLSERLSTATALPPVGLGALRRFSSGRWAASWGRDGDAEDGGYFGPLDQEGMAGRRSVGSLEDSGRGRAWE